MPWTVPPEWKGETAFILGGGETLLELDPEDIRGAGPVLALKDAGLDIAPWAECLYWADKFWCDGNNRCDPRGPRLGEHTGKYKVCRIECKLSEGHNVKVIEHDRQAGFCTDPSKIAGVDSGSNALNLAWHFGARRIVLLGFDMRGKNWDGRPRRQHTDNTYAQRFMPSLARMVEPLIESGTTVINCSPNTALSCFPIKRLEDVLAKRPRKRKAEESEAVEEPDGIAPPEDIAGDDQQDIESAIAAQQSEPEPVEPVEPEPVDEVIEPAAPDEHQVPEIYGLEMYAGAGIRQQIGKLRSYDRCFVNLRLRGPDVITSRSRQWWRTQLGLVFGTIEEHAGQGEGVRFECHRERV